MLAVLLVLLGQAVAGAPAGIVNAAQLTFSAPRTLVEIDAGKMKGSPARLAWHGSDGSFFLRWAETDRWGNERAKNYLVPATGGAVAPTGEQPDWAATYWAWKSGFSAPGVPALRFEIESRQQSKTATGSTSDAPDVANPNRSDPTTPQVYKDMASLQKVTTTTVRLKGQIIAETQNKPVSPGLTFGWAPAPLGALAYADGKSRLVVIDRDGHKLEVPGTADVLLPAWSPDGGQIAYLVKKDKKTFLLNVVTIDAK